ncbi:hypothetical protein PV729_04260 [Streptomyces europaeiscabiei]|uniref:DUF883 domain-containing protein n=1 Tax=Streptomyces europaeiscabiei TaxID=146819 RepID=A0ABU4N9U3_9ACTN|nr:hypothetical protein [Streptomyces europaeiscabiei]MDX3550991.1 hypothetical protein [Streptomyces europaeiscabiei]MDX3698449.1 hypothetical protein [Streptomyces europaeiscabiei]
MSDEHGAWVPGSELLADLRRLSELVARLDERLANDDTKAQLDLLSNRVSALEQRVWVASGVATSLGALIGIAVPFLTR